MVMTSRSGHFCAIAGRGWIARSAAPPPSRTRLETFVMSFLPWKSMSPHRLAFWQILSDPLVRPPELEVDPIELVYAFPLRPMRCSLHFDQLRAGYQLAVGVGTRQEDVVGVD